MGKIYLPSSDYPCFVVQNATTIRAYETTPRQNTTVNYVDYYYNSHYFFTNGTQTFSQYTTVPTCNGNQLTTNVFYRNDLDQILVIFFIILLVCFYFPYRIISRAFGRWLKW